MLPGSLAGKDQICVVHPQYRREDQEEEEYHDEYHVDGLHMIPLSSYHINGHIWIVDDSLSVTSPG